MVTVTDSPEAFFTCRYVVSPGTTLSPAPFAATKAGSVPAAVIAAVVSVAIYFPSSLPILGHRRRHGVRHDHRFTRLQIDGGRRGGEDRSGVLADVRDGAGPDVHDFGNVVVVGVGKRRSGNGDRCHPLRVVARVVLD